MFYFLIEKIKMNIKKLEYKMIPLIIINIFLLIYSNAIYIFYRINFYLTNKLKKGNIETFENINSKKIIHYCIGSYDINNYGVARYDYQIKSISRKFFKAQESKDKLLKFLKDNPQVLL